MCNALAALTEDEGRDLKEKVDKLAAWKNKVMGAIGLLMAMSAFIAFFLYRVVEKMDALSENINGLTRQLAVFETRVEPFIAAGPRFTPQDFKDRMEVEEVRILKKVSVMIDEEVPPPEVVQALAKGEVDHKHHETIIQSMERRIETLEKALHQGKD